MASLQDLAFFFENGLKSSEWPAAMGQALQGFSWTRARRFIPSPLLAAACLASSSALSASARFSPLFLSRLPPLIRGSNSIDGHSLRQSHSSPHFIPHPHLVDLFVTVSAGGVGAGWRGQDGRPSSASSPSFSARYTLLSRLASRGSEHPLSSP
jgi:hypothetical protein